MVSQYVKLCQSLVAAALQVSHHIQNKGGPLPWLNETSHVLATLVVIVVNKCLQRIAEHLFHSARWMKSKKQVAAFVLKTLAFLKKKKCSLPTSPKNSFINAADSMLSARLASPSSKAKNQGSAINYLYNEIVEPGI